MEQGVIKRLRVKFIVINMALAFLVLLITFGTVCALNHAKSVSTIDAHLSYVLTRAASADARAADQLERVQPLEQPDIAKADITLTERFPSSQSDSFVAPLDDAAGTTASDAASEGQAGTSEQSSLDGTSDGADERAEDGDSNANALEGDAPAASLVPSAGLADQKSGRTTSKRTLNNAIAAPVIGGGESSGAVLTAVFKVEQSGIYTTIPAYTTATLPENVLLRADAMVIDSPEARGYLPEFDLMYEKLPTDGGWLVAYANASSTHAWQNLAVLLGIVGLIALVVFFLLNILFSGWAVRPVAMSIRMQEQFTADASHELKTPLTVILANLSILRSHADATVAEQMQWVESSEREAQRMQLLVNDMLSLAQPKASKDAPASPATQERVDMSDLVEGEVLQFESVAFERGILLDSCIQEGICVNGDAEKLGRMVSTLIDNACKYVEDNGLVDVTLDVDASKPVSDPTVRLRVHNSGEPIPPEQLEHLFDRFYRADKARTGGKGGYGLGLAIGQQIAKEHNGSITVASAPGAGTTFTVTLPMFDE